MKIELPPIDSTQIESQKVETNLGQEGNNIVMSIIFPYEVTRELDGKKGMVLRNVYVELQKICNELNTTFGLDKQGFLEKIFGK